MQITCTAQSSPEGVLERDFLVGDIPGVLWSAGPGPLVLMGHGGGLHKKTPAQAARARAMVAKWGFAVAAIDAPGHGARPRSPFDDEAREGLRQAHATGDKALFKSVSLAYGVSVAERWVPEWRETLDALLQLPEFGPDTPVGYGGGITLGTAAGIPLTAADPRIRAAIFGGGFYVYDGELDVARSITAPVQFLLPWDDEHVDRSSSLALFDAFGSPDKTLHANPGDHRTVRWTGVDDAFLARHLTPAG